MTAIFRTAKAIRVLERRGVAITVGGLPLNVRSRAGLVWRFGLGQRLNGLTSCEAAQRIWRSAENDFQQRQTVLDLLTVESEAVRENSTYCSLDYEKISTDRDYASVLMLLRGRGVSRCLDDSLSQIRRFRTMKLLEETYLSEVGRHQDHQGLVLNAIGGLFNRAAVFFGWAEFDVFADLPEFQGMIGLTPNSRAHEGLSAGLHTYRILLLIMDVVNLAKGETRRLPPELRGLKAQGLLIDQVRRLARYLDEVDLRKYQGRIGPELVPVLLRFAAARNRAADLENYFFSLLQQQPLLELQQLQEGLKQVYDLHFVDFLYEIYKKVKNKKLLFLAALLHDLGKIKDQPKHTHYASLVKEIVLRNNDRFAFSKEEIAIITAIVEQHVLFGSVPLKETNYEAFGVINGVFARLAAKDRLRAEHFQRELVNVLTLVGILDVAATGADGKLFTDGIESMMALYRNYMEVVEGEKSWEEICHLMSLHGYGFGRLVSFVAEGKSSELSQAIDRLVPREEVSGFYNVVTQMRRFNQFFYSFKRMSVGSAVKMMLLISRIVQAAAQQGVIIDNVHLKTSYAEEIGEILAGYSDIDQFLTKGEIEQYFHDRRHLVLPPLSKEGVVFLFHDSEKRLEIRL